MAYARHLTVLLVGVLALGFDNEVSAKSRTGVVYADGRVVMGGGVKTKLDCTGNQDDLFSFRETVTPDSLTLKENEGESGQIDVTVEITEACESGQATFNYFHIPLGLGDDLSADPESFSITVEIPDGVGGQTINYQVQDDNETEDEESFSLAGLDIVFSVGDVFGQVSRATDSGAEELAQITIPANTDDVADVGDLPDNAPAREVDAIRSLNSACQAERQSGGSSDFLDNCTALAGQDLTSSQTQQLARGVDPHELSSQPQAAVEGGRIQNANLGNRLAALRGGATGVSLSGLSLVMNGRVFDAGWIQDAVNAQGDEGGAGASRLLGQKWGVFVNGSITVGERDELDKELGFDFDAIGVTAGVDYRFDNGLILGGALGYSQNEAELDQNGGDLDSDAISLQGFGTYNFTESLYLDATLAYMSADFEQARVVDLSSIPGFSRGVAQGGTDAEQLSSSLALNYVKAFENGLTSTLYGQVYYADTQIDPFTERGSAFPLSYPEQEFESMFWSLGARFSKAFNLENSVFNPFLDVNFGQETQFDGYFFQPTFVGTSQLGPLVEISDPDQEYGEVSVGGSWVLRSGNQFFVRVNSLFMNSETDRYNLVIGGRFEF